MKTFLNKYKGYIAAVFLIAALAVLANISIERGWITSPTLTERSERSDFIFTTAGDYGANLNTDKVLRSIGETGPDFHLMLGDFSYEESVPETAWCWYIANFLKETMLLVVTGNHESNGEDGHWQKFLECLPPPPTFVHGEYGKEYTFDFPAEHPIARFILISPNLDFGDAEEYNYKIGTPQYQWLERSIDEAREQDIPWVITGMHKDCLFPGKRFCEITPQLMNFLVSKNVDLILQSHGHIYARSKQLTCVLAGTRGVLYDESCVVKNPLTNVYEKGRGPVVIVSGTGGRVLNELNLSDDVINYYERVMGKNITPTYGYAKFSVTQDEIRGEFVAVNPDRFRDAFVIK